MTRNVASLSDLNPYLHNAQSIFVSGCAAEIKGLETIDGLADRPKETTISGIFLPGINKVDYSAIGDKFRCQSYFMTPQLAKGARVDYCPWRYRDIWAFYQKPVDAAVIMLSQPDANGQCSYGVNADYSALVLRQAKVKIGIINKQMPYTFGSEGIQLSDLDVVLEIDQPLIEVPSAPLDDISKAIAKAISGFVNDGATLQLGLGKIPAAVAQELTARSNLRVRSGLLDESILKLEAAGALSSEAPALGGVALGDAAFYQSLHKNDRLAFLPVGQTHDIGAIANTPDFIAVNGAMEVDLFGQVNSSLTSRGHFSGPGGLPEFVSGALASEGGHSIIALPATGGKAAVSKIVPQLTAGMPSVAAVDADIVITEFGVAELRNKSLAQRVQAMIAIAAPEHRDELAIQAGL